MNDLSYIISNQNKEDEFQKSLFVNNIIVDKKKNENKLFSYVPTEKWISQLGKRLFLN